MPRRATTSPASIADRYCKKDQAAATTARSDQQCALSVEMLGRYECPGYAAFNGRTT
jgi:hypothetical protein